HHLGGAKQRGDV
nr:Chain C, FIBRINOGEN, GAMMA POLYPEPTIDE [Homo sapiens]